MRFRSLVFVITLLALCSSGCESTAPGRAGPGNLSADWRSLLDAAERTRRPAQQAALRLQAVEILQGEDAAYAAQLLAEIDPVQLPNSARDLFYRLTARQFWQALAPAEAYTSITEIERKTRPDWLLLAEVCAELDVHQCSADALIEASLLPAEARDTPTPSRVQPVQTGTGLNPEPLAEDNLNRRIWVALGRARQAPPVYTSRVQHGWWLLQQAMRSATSIAEQVDAWQQWRAQHANHPATLQPPAALAALNAYRPPNIAVMLPLSGELASAGEAVQSGIAAAFLNEPPNRRGNIAFYDVAADNLAQVWEQVLQSSAEVVIGPLVKGNVDQMVRMAGNSQLPLLTLNYHNQDRADNLYQLGVAIEDEATSLAKAVRAQGYNRVAIVHSAARWSQRAMNAFSEAFYNGRSSESQSSLPGSPGPGAISRGSFTEIRGLTEAVGEAMGTNRSEGRRREIANIIGQNVEFLPRSRQDLEAIIALTDHTESRALLPALQFHFGDHLPIYATSQAARRGDIKALPGFALTELPLLNQAQRTDQPLLQAVARTYSLESSALAELFALGIDAYRLGNWIPNLQGDTSEFGFNGASGYVWLDQDGAFRREVPLIQRAADGAGE